MAVDKDKVYKKVYSAFGGVDFTSAPTDVDDRRSPDSVNMIGSYLGTPERRTGFKDLDIDWRYIAGLPEGWSEADQKINGLHTYVNTDDVKKIVAHVGKRLFIIEHTNSKKSFNPEEPFRVRCLTNKNGVPVASARNGRSMSFQQTRYSSAGTPHPILYILDGKNFYALYRGNILLVTDTDLEQYRPFVMIGANPAGNSAANDGTPAEGEAINMLSRYRRCNYYGDGSSKDYNLPEENIAGVSVVKISGATKTQGTDYTVNTTDGIISFTTAPPRKYNYEKPNVYIEYYISTEKQNAEAAKLKKCKICAKFNLDNAPYTFLSGNPDYPNYEWYNEVPRGETIPDPLYIPTNHYNVLGDERTAIKGYAMQYGNLITLKEGNGVDSTLYYKADSLDSRGDTVFSNSGGITGVGASSPYAISTVLDDPLYLSSTGVFGLDSNAITQQKSVQVRSHYISKALMEEENKRDAVATTCNNMYYLFFPNGHVYVGDGLQKTGNETGSFGYEWYYWDLALQSDKIQCCTTYTSTQREYEEEGDTGRQELPDRLFFGTVNGKLCVFKLASEGMTAYSDDTADNTKEIIVDSDGRRAVYTPNPDSESYERRAYTSRWSTKEDTLTDASSYKKILKQNIGVLIFPKGRAYAKIYYKDDKEKKINKDIAVYQDTDYVALEPKTTTIKNPLFVYGATKQLNAEINGGTDFDFDEIDFNNFSFGEYATSKFVPTKKKYRKAKKFQIIFEASGPESIGSNFGISEIHLKYKIKGRIKR